MVTPESCIRAGNFIGRERERFTSCLADAISHMNRWRILTGHNISLTLCSCHLASSAQMYSRVALVSLPGSGNTWARGLLERTTDICTGAMWCDPNLRATHFWGLHTKTSLRITTPPFTGEVKNSPKDQTTRKIISRSLMQPFLSTETLMMQWLRSIIVSWLCRKQRPIQRQVEMIGLIE